MTKRTLSKDSAVLFRKIVLVASVLCVFCFFPELSFAASPEHWISVAEESCIYEKGYTVDRKTEVYKQASKQARGSAAATGGTLVEEGSGQLEYTKQRGLRIKKGSYNTMSSQERTAKASSAPKPSPFTLDVGHMLQKMKGQAQWVLEDENASLDNQDCAILSSSGEKWLVRLWIRKKDGVVLRYDQYLNNQFISTSRIKYGQPRNGKYLPVETSTWFQATGHIFIQQYDNYSF